MTCAAFVSKKIGDVFTISCTVDGDDEITSLKVVKFLTKVLGVVVDDDTVDDISKKEQKFTFILHCFNHFIKF